jgi:N-carbamoylputrescine amidase
MPSRTLTVAAVQMACALGDRAANSAKAERLAEEAARRGASLILFPEMMPGGYTLSEEIWKTGEPFKGATVEWLGRLSRRLGAYIGTTFLEAEGEHFFNAFVLTAPDGSVCARVRKCPPASFEAYFFTGGGDPHWFDTPIGRIGVGICFENALYERYCEIHDAQVDIFLRPFSGASFEAKFPIRQRDVEALNIALRDGTAETALVMGVPVVMANKVGRLKTSLPGGFPHQDVEFPGYSAVADSDGRLLGQLGPGEEGVVVGTVTLDPARRAKVRAPELHGRWTTRMPWWAFIWVATQKLGERAYRRSEQRRVEALLRARAVT